MSPLRATLERLAGEGATGRVSVHGVRPAVVMVTEGRISLAERRDQPNLLISMAKAELFREEEWALALRLPTREKWRALVADDADRLQALRDFAHAYTREALGSLLAVDVGTPSFADRVQHPFGPLGSWALGELLPEDRDETAVLRADPYDRREFLEMLMEVSPLVRGTLV